MSVEMETKRPKKRAKAAASVGDVVSEALQHGEAATTASAKRAALPEPKTEKPERKQRPKQKEFAGMERPRILELDQAGEELREVRSQRQALTQQEVDLAQRISGLFKEHKIKGTYKLDDDYEIAIVASDFKVKVRKQKEPKDPASVKVKE
jgi:hypothetical protein